MNLLFRVLGFKMIPKMKVKAMYLSWCISPWGIRPSSTCHLIDHGTYLLSISIRFLLPSLLNLPFEGPRGQVQQCSWGHK
jgi:hypothetical protein